MAFFASALLVAPTSHGQDSRLPLASNALVLPTLSSAHVALRGTHARAGSSIAFRTAYLRRPLALLVPGPTQGGTTSSVVENVVLSELVLRSGYENGISWGVGLGAYLFQDGNRTALVTGTDDPLPTSGTEDPRLEVAWAYEGALLRARPFFELTVPLGTTPAYTAEPRSTFSVGTTLGGTLGRVALTGEAAFIYRNSVRELSFAWGPQARLGLGVNVSVLPEQLALGVEFLALPVLVGPTRQSAANQVPAEALLHATLKKDSLSFRLSGGSGVPLLRVDTTDRLQRAATSPVLRASLDLLVELDAL